MGRGGVSRAGQTALFILLTLQRHPRRAPARRGTGGGSRVFLWPVPDAVTARTRPPAHPPDNSRAQRPPRRGGKAGLSLCGSPRPPVCPPGPVPCRTCCAGPRRRRRSMAPPERNGTERSAPPPPPHPAHDIIAPPGPMARRHVTGRFPRPPFKPGWGVGGGWDSRSRFGPAWGVLMGQGSGQGSGEGSGQGFGTPGVSRWDLVWDRGRERGSAPPGVP